MLTQTLIFYLSLHLVVSQLTVLTTKGPVRGQETAMQGGMTSFRFLGIPYAKPPLGHLRFQNPESPDEWTQVVNVTKSSSNCIGFDVKRDVITGDENCLFLDVYTGQSTSTENPLQHNQWPVLIAFQGTTKLEINPSIWLYRKVLLVTINYRLQILGYLTPTKTSPPPALLDQIKALEWVHENIIGFGGDPDRVTIIGEGQTGSDVTSLLFTPLAKGLFTGAGILSAPLGTVMTSSDADEASATRVLASRVDCPQRSSHETIECLRKKSARRLIRNQQRPFHIFGPVRLRNASCVVQVPLVVGVSSRDGEEFEDFGEDVLKIVLRNFEKLKKGVQTFYGNKSVTFDMVFDSVFYAPAVEVVSAHAQHSSSFLYELRYEHPSTMLQMIFGRSNANLSVDDHVVRTNVLTLWSNFVIKGQPSIPDSPSWTPFTTLHPTCYEIDVDSKSPPSCRRIDQASFWKAIHVFDDSITESTSQNFISSPRTLENITGCTVAVTILTIISIFLFIACLCVRHPDFHLHLASTCRNLSSRISEYCARRRIPQTEVIGRNLRSRSNRRILVSERVRHKRHVLQDMARPLKQWLVRHRQNPYPTKAEKISLALNSHMTLVQVNNWFANARRRLKNVVRIPDLPWAQRIKLYNSHLEGNAEVLSISSTDSIWNDNKNDQGLNNMTVDHSYSVTDTANECRKSVAAKYKTDIMERYLRDTWTNSCDSGRTSPEEEDFSGSSGSSSTNRYWDELEAAFTLTRMAWQK